MIIPKNDQEVVMITIRCTRLERKKVKQEALENGKTMEALCREKLGLTGRENKERSL